MLTIYIIYNCKRKKIPSVLSKELLVQILSEQGYEISINDIKKTLLGKPYIENIPYRFSFSYSDNVLAIAIADSDVGVDIEKVDFCKRTDLIIKKVFSQNEKEYVNQQINTKERFFEIWTKKEAYVKYLGIGIDSGFKNYDVFSKGDDISIGTFIKKNYVLSYCVKKSLNKKIIIYCIDNSKKKV